MPPITPPEAAPPPPAPDLGREVVPGSVHVYTLDNSAHVGGSEGEWAPPVGEPLDRGMTPLGRDGIPEAPVLPEVRHMATPERTNKVTSLMRKGLGFMGRLFRGEVSLDRTDDEASYVPKHMASSPSVDKVTLTPEEEGAWGRITENFDRTEHADVAPTAQLPVSERQAYTLDDHGLNPRTVARINDMLPSHLQLLPPDPEVTPDTSPFAGLNRDALGGLPADTRTRAEREGYQSRADFREHPDAADHGYDRGDARSEALRAQGVQLKVPGRD